MKSILGKEENPKIWQNNIFKAIENIASIEEQRSSWSGENVNKISSFTEDIALLYDHYDYNRFIEYYNSLNGNDKLYKLFKELNILIQEFQETGYKYESQKNGLIKILQDKKWILITEKAEEIISNWYNFK